MSYLFPRHSDTRSRVMLTPAVFLYIISEAAALCGSSIKWSHVNVEDVYGMWYGVGYAQHTPDMTNKPEDIGCITLYITDAEDFNDEWLDWTIPRKNYSQDKWRSYKNNPWSKTPMSGSWLDVRLKRHAKREVQRKARYERDTGDKRVRVVWDEDGQSMEQTYVYSIKAPGLWTEEHWRPMERELISRGIDVWYPDDPPRHPEVIRIMKVSPEMLIINHCSESGGRGLFSLILRRSPAKVDYWEWFDLQKQFFDYDLPKVHRKAAVCAGCMPIISIICLLICSFTMRML